MSTQIHPQVIVGREREQQQLRESRNRARAGHGSLVLISGEAGIGKTTLVDDLRQQAVEDDALVLTGGCYDLTTTPPYGPWIELFASYPASDDLPHLPDQLREGGGMEGLDSQAALFNLVRQFLTELAAVRPLVLIVEDLHWSDPVSLELLRFLGRHISDEPILLVVTYRDDELTRRHELYELIPVFVRESKAQRIHLGRLDQQAIKEFVKNGYPLEDADTTRLVDYLWQRSEGNPLFVGELLFGAEDEGVLRSGPDGWALGDLKNLRVPVLLRQVLEARLRKLRPETHSALQVASVIGQEVSLDLWQTVAEYDDAGLDDVVDEALRARFLEETHAEPEFRFRHAVLREALYTSLIITRRRHWHGIVGQALATTPKRDPDEIAYHFQQAGDPQATHWLIRAGVRAEAVYARQLAAEKYQAAVTILEGDPKAYQARGWLLLEIGFLLRLIDQPKSLAYIEDAGRLALQTNDPMLAAYSDQLHGLVRCTAGEINAGLATVKRAADSLKEVASDDEERALQSISSLFPPDIFTSRQDTSLSLLFKITALPGINVLTHLYVLFLAASGRFRQAITVGEPYVNEVSNATDDLYVIRDACCELYRGLAIATSELGLLQVSQEWQSKALDAAQALGHHHQEMFCHYQQMNHLLTWQTERIDERRRAAAATVVASAKTTQAWDSNFPNFVYGLRLDILEGRWKQMQELLITAFHDFLNLQSETAEYSRLLLFGVVGCEQGKPDLAWKQVHSIFGDGPLASQGDISIRIIRAAQYLAASLALDANDSEQAQRWIKALDHWLEWSGAVPGRAEVEMLRSRYHQETGDSRLAHRHAERALEHASQPRQPLALIAAHRMLGELAIDDKRFAEAADQLDASLSLAETCEAVYEIALTRLAQAELANAIGEVDQATELLAQVRETGEALGAQLTLTRVDTLEQRLSTTIETYPGGLTAREVEVLRCVAQGETNAAIAERLYVSPRTVSQHLRTIYTKIGVNTRTEAALWAAEHGMIPDRFGLTHREVDVLRLVAQGLTDTQIAEELYISPSTVMNHVSNILGKLQVTSRTAAAAVAIREDLV